MAAGSRRSSRSSAAPHRHWMRGTERPNCWRNKPRNKRRRLLSSGTTSKRCSQSWSRHSQTSGIVNLRSKSSSKRERCTKSKLRSCVIALRCWPNGRQNLTRKLLPRSRLHSSGKPVASRRRPSCNRPFNKWKRPLLGKERLCMTVRSNRTTFDRCSMKDEATSRRSRTRHRPLRSSSSSTEPTSRPCRGKSRPRKTRSHQWRNVCSNCRLSSINVGRSPRCRIRRTAHRRPDYSRRSRG
mmetsp:Transcript_2336/g.5308  ORF Transcript_2336/g.5308 Transcript_2336/m.5308 type:complete len:240 (-) Transcript_2336:2453-3172(-)